MVRAAPMLALFGITACHSSSHALVGDAFISDAIGVDAVPPVFQPFWTSGTRFRARLWSADDGGEPIFGGWRDTLLNTNCENGKAADGVERCLPLHATIGTNAVYSDAACTQLLAYAPSSPCGQDTYAFDGSHAYKLGGAFTGTAYGYVSGTCGPLGAGTVPGSLYTVGSQAPDTSFAATQRYTTQVGGFVHEQYGYGDGSLLDLGILVFPSGTCQPLAGMRSGATLCLPTSDVIATPAYSDSACTNRAFAVDEVVSEFVTHNTSDGSMCGNSFTAYNAGTVIARGGGTYYVKRLGTCIPEVVASGRCSGTFGGPCSQSSDCPGAQTCIGGSLVYAASPSTTYPTGTLSPDATTSGRLGYLMWTGPDGVSIPLVAWDRKLSRECIAFIASDHVLRCLPHETGGSGPEVNALSYGTPSCQNTLLASGAGACDGVPPAIIHGGGGPATPEGSGVAGLVSSPSCDALPDGTGWDVSLREEPRIAYYASETACEQFPAPSWQEASSDPYGNWLAPSESLMLTNLAPATFAALQETIE